MKHGGKINASWPQGGMDASGRGPRFLEPAEPPIATPLSVGLLIITELGTSTH